jgi:hypothetical protein
MLTPPPLPNEGPDSTSFDKSFDKNCIAGPFDLTSGPREEWSAENASIRSLLVIPEKPLQTPSLSL